MSLFESGRGGFLVISGITDSGLDVTLARSPLAGISGGPGSPGSVPSGLRPALPTLSASLTNPGLAARSLPPRISLSVFAFSLSSFLP